MSFILDQIRRIDAQLDRAQLSIAHLPTSSIAKTTTETSTSVPHDVRRTRRIQELQSSIRALGPGGGNSDERALVKIRHLQNHLSLLAQPSRSNAVPAPSVPAVLEKNTADEQANAETEAEVDGANEKDLEASSNTKDNFEKELEWLLLSKASTHVYGWVLKRILDQTVELADDIWYWDTILQSRTWTAVFGVQMAPVRFWAFSLAVWEDVRQKHREKKDGKSDASEGLTESWTQFYGLVKGVVRDRNMAEMRRQVLSPVTRLRTEIRVNKTNLKKIRLKNANALGVLLGEGLANDSVHGEGLLSTNATDLEHGWKALVARNVALMEAVLTKVTDADIPLDQFDAAIGQLTEDDPLYASNAVGNGKDADVDAVAQRLSRVLLLALPQYSETTRKVVKQHGRPSRFVRYWLPAAVALLSSSTILRILVNRKADIQQWFQDGGATIIDFWQNWVIEPTWKVIKTIRHDEGSEVSLMSKRSLEGDRESLERMVVDFAIDNPAHTTGSNTRLNETEIADVRARVREGDLTPVLRAYEKDLTSPFMGTVRGNLIRALLIQIQKTKVDVEVAIGGIDALLKSQELVFGFVGLTPGILVTYFALRSVRSSFSERRSGIASRKQGKMLRQLRNIDRILTSSTPTDDGELFYQDQGLLLCEVHVLRQAVERTMPSEIYKELSEDAEELCDVRKGVERQKKAADRIRWAYAKWLS